MLLLLAGGSLLAGSAGPVFRWDGRDGAGPLVKDSSGNGLDAKSSAGWSDAAGGKVLAFDGTPKTVVSAKLPQDKLLGTASWSFAIWLRPDVLGCAGAQQNQRRVFCYGKYPEAAIYLSVNGEGRANAFVSYRDPEGKNIAANANSAPRIKTGQWQHVVFVADMPQRSITIYLNGSEAGTGQFPPQWNGNLVIGDEVMLGSTWQNFLGSMADAALWNRALTAAEINREFKSRNAAYGVTWGDGRPIEEVLTAWSAEANQAMQAKKYADAREILAKITHTPAVTPLLRGWAQLREAQSYRLEGNLKAAQAIYARVRGDASLPAHHQQEAADILSEIKRRASGRPARDAAASRVTIPPIAKFAAEVFVSPAGNDANPGTAELPVASLPRARDLIRARRATIKAGPVAVILRNGEYPVSETLTLTAEDSGTAGAPVVWKAEHPGKAVLYGGTRITGFTPVTDPAISARLPEEARGKVQQCDLKAAGITDYGKLAVRGFSQPASPPTLELFVDGKPMTPARWPNEGFARATRLVQPGDKKTGAPSIIGYADDRHARWTQAEDAWIFGYFHWLWADATAKIGAIDAQAKTLTTAEAYHYNNEGMNEVQGIIYHAFNLLEEIDRPGEWYLNRSNGILYLYPPGDPQTSKALIEISMLGKPMITASKLAHTRFEGLTLDLSRADGAILRDSSDCVLAGCTVSRMAGNGVSILGGNRDLLLSCNIHTIGKRASEVAGGDRATLTPGNHVVANCEMHDFGRIDRTYTPGVQLDGVGNRVTHNSFHNCPSTAVHVAGNDHLIEYNEVRDAVLESDDQGAMELFGNPTFRGVVFRYNLFADIGSKDKRQLAHDQAGIRFDDVISGMLVYGNVFYRAATGKFGAVQINSGRDNLMDNNLFVDCAVGVSGGFRATNKYWVTLKEGGKSPDCILTELYLKRYPELNGMLDEPAVNRASRNIFIHCARDFTGSKTLLELLSNTNVPAGIPNLENATASELQIDSDAPVAVATGFRPIPMDQIGRYPDPWNPAR